MTQTYKGISSAENSESEIFIVTCIIIFHFSNFLKSELSRDLVLADDKKNVKKRCQTSVRHHLGRYIARRIDAHSCLRICFLQHLSKNKILL